MNIELTEEELLMIKSALNFAIYWTNNRENIRCLKDTLDALDKELEKAL